MSHARRIVPPAPATTLRDGLRRVSRLRALAALAGLLTMGWLAWEIGPAQIGRMLDRLSWHLPLLCLLPFACVALLDTVGWHYAFPGRTPGFALLVVARLAGEAVNVSTPSATVGGEPVKAWLLSRAGLPTDEGLVSVVVAKSALMASQLLFLGMALGVGARTVGLPTAVMTALAAIASVGAVIVASFVWAQQRRLFGTGSRVLGWLGLGASLARHAARVDAGLADFYRHRRGRFALSILFHLLGWVAGSLEMWLSLWLLDVSVDLPTVLIIEALVTAVRSATFLIPASLGAQEGSLVGVFLALGLASDVGLACGLVRRLREVTWAALGYLLLLTWRRRSP